MQVTIQRVLQHYKKTNKKFFPGFLKDQFPNANFTNVDECFRKFFQRYFYYSDFVNQGEISNSIEQMFLQSDYDAETGSLYSIKTKTGRKILVKSFLDSREIRIMMMEHIMRINPLVTITINEPNDWKK